MTDHRPPAAVSGIFQPTWGRGFFVLSLAITGFLLPQKMPLEWYPLNEPGTDVNYLEISCASDKTGEVQILYDLALDGHRPIDTIRFPISPTKQAYTYTFPLPDAPIVEMRVAPPAHGGTLILRQMRIINRRGEEIRRFTRDLFRTGPEITEIAATMEGWQITSAANATNPAARIELFSPIIPAGKDHRNLLRCLLSTGYLSMMLWILLLAVFFTFHRPTNWRGLLSHLGFMACLALLFAIVGNRGLIRNSVHYARYKTNWPVDPGLRLEFDLASSQHTTAQLFWDTGQGLNKTGSMRQDYEPHPNLQTLRFPLPNQPLRALRFKPCDNAGRVEIHGIRVVDSGQRTHAVLPLSSLQPKSDTAKLQPERESLIIEIPPLAKDPITEFSPAALDFINKAWAGQGTR